VTWAHASDLPNATDWLAPGEFLMSNGLNVPSGADDQVAFLGQLDAAGLSGLAIGDDMHAPALTPPLLARAEALDFPVLAIPHEVPFVAVSRAVAGANSSEEHGRLLRTLQLYECFRDGVSSGNLGGLLLSELGRQLDCRLLLLDITTGLPALPEGESPVPDELRVHLVEELRSRSRSFPGVLRLGHNDRRAYAIRVPTERLTALVAFHDSDQTPDLALLQHAGSIAALEVERVNAQREQKGHAGSGLLADLLERRLDPASATRQLREHGIESERVVLVAFSPRGGSDGASLHHELAQLNLTHLVLSDVRRGLAVVPDSDASLTALRRVLGAELPLGISDGLGRPDRVPDAAREARWAQSAAHNLGRPAVRYGEGTPLFLPRTLGEAAMAAERVLGPVIAYDRLHSTELVRSLEVFLNEDRSWQRTAGALHVHKQTVVYRMHRLEELTGRSLHDTADVAQFWLALRALEFAHGDPARDAQQA
jgi:PucR family transcriptional regulator, purine catabolism regulatory protein